MNKLVIKLIINTAIVIVIQSLCLFLPATSLDYWQGWMYLTVFFVPPIFITPYLLRKDPQLVERRVTAKEQRLIQKLFRTFFFFLFFSLFVIAGFDHRFHWSDIPTSFVIIANIAVLLSWEIFYLVLRENSYASSAVEVTATQKVISSGPYGFVRHPMYAGMLLLVLFTPIALDSWWGMPSSFLIAVAVVLRLLDEEKVLSKNLAAYDEYCKKVRFRLVPGIW